MNIKLRTGLYIGLVAGVLTIGGCQTDGGFSGLASSSATGNSASTSKTYTIFFDQSDHLKELLANNQVDEAATLYENQKGFFSKEPEKHRSVLDQLAKRLKQQYLTNVEGALNGTENVSWPTAKENWDTVKSTLADARQALNAYPSGGILDEPAYLESSVAALRTKFDDIEAKISASASDEFLSFDHFGETSFFNAYPAEISASSILDEHFDTLKPKLETSSTAELKAFSGNYGKDVLGEDRWVGLGNAYMSAQLREMGATDRSDIPAILSAVNATKDAGFEPKSVPGLNIAFVEVTSKTLLNEGQIDFPVSTEVDLPVDVTKADLDDALSSTAAGGNDLLIVFDVALAKASRRVQGLNLVNSVLLAGYKSVENPEHGVAQQNVEVAKINFNSASISASGYHGYGLAGAFSQMIAGAQQSSARGKLQAAMQNLANTPKTIEEPIYNKYQFKNATVDARKAMTVHYYVIDLRRKTYVKSTFDVNEEHRFNVAYNIDPEDTKKAEHVQEYDTESEIDDYEKAASSVKLSQIINHYIANRGSSKKLRSLTALRKEMLKDKNRALANYKANTFDARPLNDPRFDSVVAVYVGKGSLGSGFFVKPDVVLTNWHVVENAKFVEMKMYDGRETFGRVLGKDVRLDLALVKVQARGKPVRFFTKNRIDLGKTTEAIGHPRGLEFSITRGIVSAVRKHYSISLPKGAGDEVLYIQTDAPINPGNSGGPLFLDDYVIGVNTWKRGDSEGLNFSVHYSEALAFMKEHLPGFRVLTN